MQQEDEHEAEGGVAAAAPATAEAAASPYQQADAESRHTATEASGAAAAQMPPQVSGEVVMELLTQRWDLADTGGAEVRTRYTLSLRDSLALERLQPWG